MSPPSSIQLNKDFGKNIVHSNNIFDKISLNLFRDEITSTVINALKIYKSLNL